MLLETKIEEVITEPLNSRGFDIVRIKYSSKVLQIMIEKTGAEAVSVGDCEKVSKLVSMILDADDIISDNYNLEVSSPGLDRPLIKLADFIRFKGKEAKFSLSSAVNEKKKFKGKITKVTDSIIHILPNESEEEIEVEFENIISSNLVTKIDFNKQ